MWLQTFRMLLVGSILSGFFGCSDGLESLDGTVTIDGEPAPAGISLRFDPIAGGSPSYAKTDEHGKYVAAFTFKRNGIQIGEHRVHLMPGSGGGSAREGGREKMPSVDQRDEYINSSADTGQQKSESMPNLPKRYYQEIMTIKVEPGRNTIDIPMESTASED